MEGWFLQVPFFSLFVRLVVLWYQQKKSEILFFFLENVLKSLRHLPIAVVRLLLPPSLQVSGAAHLAVACCLHLQQTQAGTYTHTHTNTHTHTHNSSFWRQNMSSSYHNDRWDLSQADPKCSLYQLPWSQHVMSRSRSRSRGSYSYSSDYSSCSAKHREARSGEPLLSTRLPLAFLFQWNLRFIYAGKHHCYGGWCSSCCGAMCGPSLWVLGLVGNLL